jgi:hypothetical protein
MKELESQSKRKSKSKPADRGGAKEDETTGPDTGDESNSGFGPPSDRKSRTKKREHDSGTGVTPDPKRSASTFTSSYSQGGAILERTPAQIRATKMAADDKANRSLMAEGRRPRPRGSGLGGGDIRHQTTSRERGGGHGNGRGFGRSGSGGGSLGRSINGNGSGRDGNIPKFIKHPQSSSEAAGTAALTKESGRKAVREIDHDPELLGAEGDNDKNPNSTDKDNTVGNDNVTVSFLESKELNDLAGKSVLASKTAFVTSNPSFAAKLAEQLTAAERTLYLFSSQEERLELTETQFNTIMGELEEQAIACAVAKVPAPKIKWCRFSQYGDKGYLGVRSDKDAKVVMEGISRIVIGGIKFRAWLKEELEPRHLVSIDISIHQSNLGVSKIMAGFMAANELQGKATKARIVKVGGWCKVTRALYDTIKFFADNQLYEQLSERRNGDTGRRLYLIVGRESARFTCLLLLT